MKVHATWFGPEDCALLGFLHIPDGRKARGGVVLCPPLGQEQIDSYRAMTLAAQQLCAAGLVVLRFDYEGTGDSTGDSLAADAVDRWIRSIGTAVEFLRSTGVENLSLVGLRMGALLAVAARQQCGPLTSLALWDPVVNGRTYLRRQATLYRMTVGEDAENDGVVSIPAAVFAPEAARAIGQLKLDSFADAAAGQPLLLVTRSTGPVPEPVRDLVDAGAVLLEVEGQEELLERPSSHFRIPSRSIQHITRWIAEGFPAAALPVTTPPLRRRTRVGSTHDGEPVVEVLHRCGPHDLFAVETTAASASRSLVLYSASKEHRVGPARMHVRLARELAGEGVQVIRFDRRGTGESGAVEWDEQTPMYSPESVADSADILALAAAPPADRTLTGICAGAWMAAMGALAQQAGSVVLLCPIIWAMQTREDKVAAAQLTIDQTESERAQRSRRLQIKAVLRHRLPYVLWRALGRRGVTQVPEVLLAALFQAGVDVTVLMPPADYVWFIDQRGPEGLRRLRRKGMDPRIVCTEAGDHSLLHRDTREQAVALLSGTVSNSTSRQAVTETNSV